MKPRRWFTRSQWFFLLFMLNACMVVLGSILLSRCRNYQGHSAHEAAVAASQSVSHASSAKTYAVPSSKPEAFTFDPNEADSTQLLRLGLAPYQVRSIYRYRAKGGRFSTKDDFRRVYRLTNEQWEHLHHLIRIDKKYQLVSVVESRDPRLAPRRNPSLKGESSSDTISPMVDTIVSSIPKRTYPEKLSCDETLDINTADSALLCRVPGIGPYYSRQIIRYRRRLGGFVSTEQLLQIENFPADALAWMEVVDSTSHQKLFINRLSTRKLMKHPYMGYYRASEISNYRRIHGPIKDASVLRTLPHFSEEDVARLLPYLSFE